ncbi:MAG: hypothetical protein A3H42_05970 [Deltaproteobacteria bacterium RIFCSPLOWO2_02_FULL_46_8]|nr:MAG: hypothetical protein A3H42_05970 [Deltaproteobacteria bacterium RIFCSPLOWO2_02_FULL_46_8]
MASMDRIQKALQKLSSTERQWIKDIIEQLKRGQHQGLHIKRLKAHHDVLRVRKGDIRIIYRQSGDDIFLLAIERRLERTYRDF